MADPIQDKIKLTLAEWLEKNMNESGALAKGWVSVLDSEIENAVPSAGTFNTYLQYQAQAMAWHRAFCEHAIFVGDGKYLPIVAAEETVKRMMHIANRINPYSFNNPVANAESAYTLGAYIHVIQKIREFMA